MGDMGIRGVMGSAFFSRAHDLQAVGETGRSVDLQSPVFIAGRHNFLEKTGEYGFGTDFDKYPHISGYKKIYDINPFHHTGYLTCHDRADGGRLPLLSSRNIKEDRDVRGV